MNDGEVTLETVNGWYCPECRTFNVVGHSIKPGMTGRCEDCGYEVVVKEPEQ